MKVLQGTKPLVPLQSMSIIPNAFRLLHCHTIGYSDKEPPLQAKLRLDMRDILRSED